MSAMFFRVVATETIFSHFNKTAGRLIMERERGDGICASMARFIFSMTLSGRWFRWTLPAGTSDGVINVDF